MSNTLEQLKNINRLIDEVAKGLAAEEIEMVKMSINICLDKNIREKKKKEKNA